MKSFEDPVVKTNENSRGSMKADEQSAMQEFIPPAIQIVWCFIYKYYGVNGQEISIKEYWGRGNDDSYIRTAITLFGAVENTDAESLNHRTV